MVKELLLGLIALAIQVEES